MVSGGRRIDLPGADILLYEDAIPNPQALFDRLTSEVKWRQQRIRLFGRDVAMPRLSCWMGDAAYTYSGLVNRPAPWNAVVQSIRTIAEALAREQFNGVLLNLYRDGKDSMGWHADDEAELGSVPTIASVSLGWVRRMRFKAKRDFDGRSMGFDLPSASVLVMRGPTQRHWLHAVPRTRRDIGARINLTFRRIV